MIEVESLSRRFGNTNAVNDISFRIASNEIVGLLGHNGAGKTTVMRMLTGYLEPHSGSIHIHGLSMADQSRQVQQQLGYLPEHLPVYSDMMVADYLDYAATLKGINKRDRTAAIRQALLATDLTDRALDPVATLSRGLKQRVGVAQAILGRPRLLILDEPTNGLDPQQTEHMRQLIRHLSRRATIILSTHIMQEVDATCDRVLIMRNGALVLDQHLESLRRSSTLRLQVSPGAPDLATHLKRMPQVIGLEPGTPDAAREEYLLRLHEDADIDRAAGNIAECVHRSGARLYCLHPLARSLDSVYREVSNRD